MSDEVAVRVPSDLYERLKRHIDSGKTGFKTVKQYERFVLETQSMGACGQGEMLEIAERMTIVPFFPNCKVNRIPSANIGSSRRRTRV